MTEQHVPGWEPRVKMDTPTGLYGATCSCGWRGSGLFGSEAQALRSAGQHSKAKDAAGEV